MPTQIATWSADRGDTDAKEDTASPQERPTSGLRRNRIRARCGRG
jgi:hypothetical protein